MLSKILIPTALFVATFLGLQAFAPQGLTFGAPTVSSASARIERTILPETTSRYELGTTSKTWLRGFFDTICLNGDCQSAWPAGGGSSFSTTSANFWSTAGLGFSTTSTNYWKTVNNFYSTTSADYWKTQNNFFSTTSADYLQTQRNYFSTTSADFWDTLKPARFSFTPTTNYGAAANSTSSPVWFTNGMQASSTSRFVTLSASTLTLGTLNGPLHANNGTVGATTSIGIVYGGTGLTAIGASSTVLTTNGTIAIWQSIVSYIETTVRAASLVLAGAWDFGGATGLEIPNGSAPTVDAVGEIALDTTSNLLIVGTSTSASAAGTIPLFQFPAFTYATATAWTGTTTIPLGTAFQGEDWLSAQCFTDVGTVNVSIYDGTNRMDMFNASTTVGTVILKTNNSFTAAEKRYIDIGTPASSPTKISCTVKKMISRD